MYSTIELTVLKASRQAADGIRINVPYVNDSNKRQL